MKKHLLFIFCIISIGLTAQLPSYVPTNGLVGWWPFNGNSNDESGNGNNGTVNGATLTTDRFGVANKAYSFNGSNLVSNFITLNNPLNNSTTFTFSYWIKRTENIGAKWHIMILGSNANHELLFNYDTLIYRNFYNGNLNDVKAVISNNLDYNHICVTSNGNETKLIVNGNQIGSINLAIISTINGTMHIGKHSAFQVSSATSFNGKLDDIAIYNRALSQQEITNLYSGSAPPSITTTSTTSLINCGESATLTASSTSAAQPCLKADLPASLQNGLVGYWPFCGNANDASGNNNNGTVNGATLTSDRFGNSNSAYQFNGGSNRIVINNSILPSQPTNYTISMWCFFDNSQQNQSGGDLLCDRNTSNYNYKYRILTFGNTIRFFTVNGSNVSFVDANYLQSSWNHIIVIGDIQNNTLKIYLNGILMATSIIYYPSHLNATTIGANFAPGSPGYDPSIYGKLDDISIYNRALSSSEVQQLYMLNSINYSWSPGSATSPTITVSPTQTTTYTCTASNLAGSSTSSITVNVADTLTWTGTVDTNWHKPCNWNPQFVPKCCNNVLVPFSSNQPVVSGIAAAEDVSINSTSGAVIKVNAGANLQVGVCPITITQSACPSLAVITTTAVSSITSTTAVSGGTITYQGATAVTARGICWSTSTNPTLANSFSTNGTGVGTFVANLTGLTAGTTYYVRAYATNASGTSYGNEVSFVSQALQVGQSFEGGVIAYIDNTGLHGFVVAPNDQSNGVYWHVSNIGVTGASGTSVGTGNNNTINITNMYGSENNAARICFDFVLGGFSDWFLPSKDELYHLYLNKLNIGGFSNSNYWSSSEEAVNASAWNIDFTNGNFNNNAPKFSNYKVRAIRYF